MTPSPFTREDGTPVRSLSLHELSFAITALSNEHHLSEESIIEGSAYSLAMVSRYALGLSSSGGRVCGFVTPGLPGAIVLACLRALVNGGAEAVALVIDSPLLTPTALSNRLEMSATSYGVQTLHIGSGTDLELLRGVVTECHNILWGVLPLSYGPENKITSARVEDEPFMQSLIGILNNSSTPIHTVLGPSGFDLITGERRGELLYASSTLSLGAPLHLLKSHSDTIGRHYLADIGLPLRFYEEVGEGISPHFHEQPVIKLAFQEEGTA